MIDLSKHKVLLDLTAISTVTYIADVLGDVSRFSFNSDVITGAVWVKPCSDDPEAEHIGVSLEFHPDGSLSAWLDEDVLAERLFYELVGYFATHAIPMGSKLTFRRSDPAASTKH
jgi:hypothetical protein